MKKLRKTVSLLLTAAVFLSLMVVGAFAMPSDVESGAWYADAVSYVYDNGIMTGVAEDEFAPNLVLNRATIFQTFYNMEGRPEVKEDNFADVKGTEWFAAAAAWAKQTGMSDGTEVGFEGLAVLTRAQLVKVIVSYLDLKGVAANAASLGAYSDAGEVPEWAMASMGKAIGAGLVNGKTDTTLDPAGSATRAELAQILHRMSRIFETKTVGKVGVVDKYGNITLDLYAQNLFNADYEIGDILTITLGEETLEAPLCTAYSDVDTGSLVVRVPGGSGAAYVMVAINMGNFAGTYNVEAGDEVTFELKEKAGYLEEWEMRQLDSKRTNNRDDYESDEVFANFRNISTTGMGEGVLYRSSSPVNPELGRAAYADDLSEKAGIMTVINLADSEEELDGYFAAEDFDSPYYEKLYDSGSVIYLNMGVDLKADEFKTKLKEGLLFLVENEGPFLIHCTEGKDRAGFVAGVLEALMGASIDEIKEDYMQTYINYYHIEYGSEQYGKIAESNIMESMRYIAGLEKGADLSGVDLVKAAEDYLVSCGLTAAQVQSLKTLLEADIAADSGDQAA